MTPGFGPEYLVPVSAVGKAMGTEEGIKSGRPDAQPPWRASPGSLAFSSRNFWLLPAQLQRLQMAQKCSSSGDCPLHPPAPAEGAFCPAGRRDSWEAHGQELCRGEGVGVLTALMVAQGPGCLPEAIVTWRWKGHYVSHTEALVAVEPSACMMSLFPKAARLPAKANQHLLTSLRNRAAASPAARCTWQQGPRPARRAATAPRSGRRARAPSRARSPRRTWGALGASFPEPPPPLPGPAARPGTGGTAPGCSCGSGRRRAKRVRRCPARSW